MDTSKIIVVCLFVCSVQCHRHADKPTDKPSDADPPPPKAVSPSGVFRGSWMTSQKGRLFQAYRGIRYAEPPIGALRFQPPKLMHQYPAEVDASAEGPACPMPAEPGEYFFSEDCLMINVYTPATNSSRPLPVVFYIHSGGFYSMTGRSDLAGPHYLLDRDLVLVTINYRLASLGFIATGDKYAPGNNGMKDQVVALKWVQRNIAGFGGDPNSVTIAGCSAGSISVILHSLSPMSKGLFHRGIAMSASPIPKTTTPHHLRDLAQRQARAVNCPEHDSKAMLDCLMKVPWRDLGNSLLKLFEFGYDPIALWLPNVEDDFGQERFLTEEPIDIIKRGDYYQMPLIISQTTDEFFWKAFSILNNATLLSAMNANWESIAPVSFSLPRDAGPDAANRLKLEYLSGKDLKNDSYTANGLGRLYGDAVIGFSVHRLANLMCRHSSKPVFYYELNYFGNHSHYEHPITHKPRGAAHHDDLIYLFTLSYRFPMIELGTEDSKIVDRMTAIWYNFAKHGDPNPHGHNMPELTGLKWPAMKPADRKYLKISKEFSIHNNMAEERFKVWDELFPIQY